ncbi:GNAT family N-acetyltransferase [Bacillus salacetis]|uniref:GNAT family N-acetyltransferase n=1 Tax=Bacillus salacetis TaxID=2315464 RepID=UPI003B9F80FC
MEKKSLLRGNRIILRELQEDDWLGIHDYASQEQASRFQPWGPNTEEETKIFVQEALDEAKKNPRNRFFFVIQGIQNNELLGAVELNISDFHNQAGDIGYIINPKNWGEGFATEAAQLVLRYGFEVLKLHRIYATCSPENAGSARVLEKVGMTKEGTMRDHLKMKDGWRDSSLYSILENEI